jgi:predicted RNA-binding Zn-ribbon protein involved in translation (DUF1610 family)
MENKTEINCPNCNQKVRIPTGKHIKFNCPNCSNEFEIDGRVKEASKKSNYTWIYTSILTGLLIFGYKYYTKKKEKNDETNVFNTLTNSKDNKESAKQDQKESSLTNAYDKNLDALVKAIDKENPITSDFAASLASQFPGKYNVGQICQVYDYVVHEWKYVNDTRSMENFRSASRSINLNLSGDCDDFAILIAALIESIGGQTRISFAYNDEGGHAFTELYAARNREEMQQIVEQINNVYKTNNFEINFTEDADGACWLNMDWFGSPRHPGGKYFDFKKRTIYYPTIKNPTYIQE